MTAKEIGPLGLERLENLEEYLEDILERKTPIVSTEQIAILASKRKPLDARSEVKAIERQTKTRCHCRHLAVHVIGGICYYKQCRHAIHAHPQGGRS